jgi:hypothetical protein
VDRHAIARRRLRNLRLTGPRLASPEAVVGWLGAVQSQDVGPGTWSIAQRLGKVRAPAIEAAIAAGRIVRTHVLRPTWHFVLAEDLRWMQALTAPRVRRFLGYYDRRLGIDARVRARTAARLADALRGGRELTRAEIGALLGATGQRLAHLLIHPELDALICSGRPRGAHQTYALVDERVAPARALDRDEALATLTGRYFTSHGPATVKDFQWWSSLPRADILRGLELAGDRLEREELGGLTFWHAGAAAPRRAARPVVHLLQAYDEYSVGYTESKHLLADERVTPGWSGSRTVFNNLIFVDGLLVGRWRRTVARGEIGIELQLQVRLARAARDALDAAVRAVVVELHERVSSR